MDTINHPPIDIENLFASVTGRVGESQLAPTSYLADALLDLRLSGRPGAAVAADRAMVDLVVGRSQVLVSEVRDLVAQLEIEFTDV